MKDEEIEHIEALMREARKELDGDRAPLTPSDFMEECAWLPGHAALFAAAINALPALLEERKELLRRVEVMQRAVNKCGELDCFGLKDERDFMHAKLAERNRDTKRLDWLVSKQIVRADPGYLKSSGVWIPVKSDSSARAAIDAAMGEDDAD